MEGLASYRSGALLLSGIVNILNFGLKRTIVMPTPPQNLPEY
jgi:hypothetical protein